MRRLFLALFLLLVSGSAFAVPPHSISVMLESLKNLPHVEVTAKAHDAKPIKWSGVRLQSLLEARFATPAGDKLGSGWLAAVVRCTGADGSQVVFTLAELNTTLGHLDVLVADHQDGKPLPAEDGPVRLVVPSDQRGARWLRQLVRIDLIELQE
jgi:DMSO/TMAO reductase YedYZ molybdopterin-dependent catalytic subunit